MSFNVLMLAFALVLIFEGLGPALVPNKWKLYLLELSQQSEKSLRIIGISLILIGWLIFLLFKA